MQNFKNLNVYKEAYGLCLDIYKETECFPKKEIFGLVSQIRRATTSISANIAEGCGKSSNKDLARFLEISIGSANEIEFFINLSLDLKYLSLKSHNNLIDKIIKTRKMLISFRKYIVSKT